MMTKGETLPVVPQHSPISPPGPVARIAEKIAALHRRRYEEDPALAELVSNLNSYTGSSAPGPHAG